MFALVSTATRRQINLSSHNQIQPYTQYTFRQLYNNPQSYNHPEPHSAVDTAHAMDMQTYAMKVDQQHSSMTRFIEKVKRNTQNMKDSDLKDFAMELVEDCQSWADCWKLAADIAGEAWKAFRKAGVVIEEEVHAILDKSRSLGEQAIRRAIRNSRRVLRLARKYPEIYEGQQDEWEELEQFVNRVDMMIEGRLRTDAESVSELRCILDHIHTWHERALDKIRVTGGELDRSLLDGELTSDEEDAKSEDNDHEPGAQIFPEGQLKNLDAFDSYITRGEGDSIDVFRNEDDNPLHEHLSSHHGSVVDHGHLRDVYDELKKSDVQWKWVSQIVNSLNLITVITFTGVGIFGLFLRRSSPDKNKTH